LSFLAQRSSFLVQRSALLRTPLVIPRAIDFSTGKALEYEDFEDEDDDYDGLDEDEEDEDEEVSLCEGVGDVACLAPTPPVP